MATSYHDCSSIGRNVNLNAITAELPSLQEPLFIYSFIYLLPFR